MRINRNSIALAVALFFSSGVASAQHLPATDPVGLRGDMSGSWYNPAQSGHGLVIEGLASGKAALTWLTFAPDGMPMWLVGLAEIEGSSLRAPVMTVSGGRFPPHFDPSAISRTPWGELRIDFIGCNSAHLSWNSTVPGFEAGSMPLSRITSIDGLRCNAAEEFGETRVFSFERGTLGFTALFADKPAGDEDFYELEYAYEALPAPLTARRGVRLSGNNHSDDLAMLVKAPIRGLRGDGLYRIAMEMELASHVPYGCFGVGGSPGEGVHLRLGATTSEPLVSGDGQADGWQRLNFDFGHQSNSTPHALAVGTLATSRACDLGSVVPWELKTVSTGTRALQARADTDGTLWVVAGSDSGFEGRSDWYITRLTVHLDAIVEPQ